MDRKYQMAELEGGRPRSALGSQTYLKQHYGGFEQQKHVWEATARRSERLWYLAMAQIFVGILSCFNFLWLTNAFAIFAGITGLLAVRSERMGWTIVYLVVCTVEFGRNVLLAMYFYHRFIHPEVHITSYQSLQIIFLFTHLLLLIPGSFGVVFSATSALTNPLW